jgi:chemotaxis protein methyltransferase CheR
MGEKFQRLQISDEELTSFTLAVKTRYGLDFTNYEKKSLKRGLVRLIAKNDLKSMIGLWVKVLRDRGMIISYIDELLVNLTEFFRNYDLWQKLRDDVLPEIQHLTKLSFWHAGCSTGEEVYSMGIVLKEAFLLHKSEALATDLSSGVLAQAAEGRYNELIWNKCKTSYLFFNSKGNHKPYFRKEEKDYFVTSQLKQHVEFQRHNLVHDGMQRTFKIIFCRNVMIYFDDALKMKVLELFHDSLDNDGFFIIGYYDMLPYESKDLFTLYCPTTRIYTKKIK